MRTANRLADPPTPVEQAQAPLMSLAQFACGHTEWLFRLDPKRFLPDPHAFSELQKRILVEEVYAKGPRAANRLDAAECAAINQPAYGGESAHVYGNTDCDLLPPLFCELRGGRSITADDVFFDLGSGDGRLCLQMLLFTPLERSVGIELSVTRHELAVAAHAEVDLIALSVHKTNSAQQQQPEQHHGSMLEQPLGDATLVFCYNLCLDDAFLARLRERLLEQLPLGACVLLRGKALPEAAPHDDHGSRPKSQAADSGGGRRRLALRLRLTVWYGYCVVEEAETPSSGVHDGRTWRSEAALIRRPALKQTSLRLGTSPFRREAFVAADGKVMGGDKDAQAAAADEEGDDPATPLSDLAIMVALKPKGPDRDALAALLAIETRDRRHEAQPGSSSHESSHEPTGGGGASAGSSAGAARCEVEDHPRRKVVDAGGEEVEEEEPEHYDPLIPVSTPPEQAGRHMSHADLQRAQRSTVRVLHNLLDAREIATLLSTGVASAALGLDGRTRTVDAGLLYDVSYEHDAHTALFLHRRYAPTDGAAATCSLSQDHAPTAQVCDKLVRVMREHVRAVDPQEGIEDPDALTVRCIELHTYTSGGALLDVTHRDTGSVLSLSVLLSDPAAKTGGHFVTWQRGQPVVHQLTQGSAIVFHSERRHNVSPMVHGMRQTLVIELWACAANVRGRES